MAGILPAARVLIEWLGKADGAGFDALAAADASFGEEKDRRRGIQTFRIVAPPALHGTAFEEDRGADSRAVMDRVPLDVEHDSRSRGARHRSRRPRCIQIGPVIPLDESLLNLVGPVDVTDVLSSSVYSGSRRVMRIKIGIFTPF